MTDKDPDKKFKRLQPAIDASYAQLHPLVLNHIERCGARSLYPVIWIKGYDAARDHYRKQVAELVDVAMGKTKHLYAGLCPDETQQETLDPHCPTCRIIAKLKDQP